MLNRQADSGRSRPARPLSKAGFGYSGKYLAEEQSVQVVATWYGISEPSVRAQLSLNNALRLELFPRLYGQPLMRWSAPRLLIAALIQDLAIEHAVKENSALK